MDDLRGISPVGDSRFPLQALYWVWFVTNVYWILTRIWILRCGWNPGMRVALRWRRQGGPDRRAREYSNYRDYVHPELEYIGCLWSAG